MSPWRALSVWVMGAVREEISCMVVVASRSETEFAAPPPRLNTSPRKRGDLLDLKIQQSQHVFHKQDVAHLFSLPAKVGQRQLKPMRDGPPDDPTLIRVSELARTRNHAETIDHNRQIISLGVFLARGVGDQFAETVDAALTTIDRKLFRNAVDGMEARGALLGGKAIPGVGIVFEARGRFAARERIQAIGAINAIGAPEDQGKPTGSERIPRCGWRRAHCW